ncbi:MAG: hypothetical protein Q7J31_04430 [Syntrophales bacterium]|nr:hypothetical protein [Syntrophales bacterium]
MPDDLYNSVSLYEMQETPRESFTIRVMSRLSRLWDRLAKVLLISFLLLISTGAYFIALNIFFPGEKKAITALQKEKPAALKIMPMVEIKIPEEKPKEMQINASEKKEAKPKEAWINAPEITEQYLPLRRPPSNIHTPQIPKPPALQSLSADELVSIGQANMGKGSFPALIFAYPDPVAFIRQMYSLGAKTLISVNDRFYEINLMDNSGPVPFTSADFEGFSNFRRVIDDVIWESYKRQSLQQIGLPRSDCALLLLVPMNLELKWRGYQTHILQQLGIAASDVLNIEANFQNSKLKLTRTNLKNGMTQIIHDITGA